MASPNSLAQGEEATHQHHLYHLLDTKIVDQILGCGGRARTAEDPFKCLLVKNILKSRRKLFLVHIAVVVSVDM
jgi:hypothetical protein